MSDAHAHFSSRMKMPLHFMKHHITKVYAGSTHTSIHSSIFVQDKGEMSASCCGMFGPDTH